MPRKATKAPMSTCEADAPDLQGVGHALDGIRGVAVAVLVEELARHDPDERADPRHAQLVVCASTHDAGEMRTMEIVCSKVPVEVEPISIEMQYTFDSCKAGSKSQPKLRI